MTKKYQIFVSSTYSDLIDEREQVIKAVLEMGHIPVGMEMFSAADDEQWKLIARQIDEIDYYVLIVAHRYGSVTTEGISYTEKEFDYAVLKGVPVLGFVIDDDAPWPKSRHEEDSAGQKKLTSFKQKVKGRLIHFWKNKEELHGKVSISLMKSITANPRTGWVRANEATGPEVIKELSRLSSENAALREETQNLRKQREEQLDEVRSTIRILSNNSRKFKVRKTSSWDDATRYTNTLADIFHYSAANLITENTDLGVAQNIALAVSDTNYYKNFPIGSNIVSDMIADMAALDLVEPSRKKHSVNDKNRYWTLTKLGKQVLKEFRRVRLEEGLDSSSDVQLTSET
ncbi:MULTISPECIES: DUF4062 domain-containing protein [unclassified Methylophilus]|uniref:DUF4062 domain-containing protein n=1 Tax=unclassified Methylophilus TaxID=2630143 RepID=UPI0006F41708|nr:MULTISPECIES: DUF4062 domain-containing protein [unclassified Methylophilus]KQT41331.1 hypothetical protein ASG34_11340 [Methylophilus sp. Leaf416]KQT57852.1 hypothetical protein ASG44_12940 [Methylophilus sp. Leaf459]